MNDDGKDDGDDSDGDDDENKDDEDRDERDDAPSEHKRKLMTEYLSEKAKGESPGSRGKLRLPLDGRECLREPIGWEGDNAKCLSREGRAKEGRGGGLME